VGADVSVRHAPASTPTRGTWRIFDEGRKHPRRYLGAHGSLVLNGCTLGGYVRAFDDNPELFEVIDAGTTIPAGASFETAGLVKRLPLSVEVS